MSKKMMKKVACNILALASVVACAGTFTACETAHPKVEMEIEFNGETYSVEYKLFRKIAPSTVSHFLFLVENGYYDGLCVHNYDISAKKMYTGAYSATTNAEDEDGLLYKGYYEEIKKFSNYAEYPASVWFNENRTTPTYTVYGEFSSNKFSVESGALKQEFGSLTMYYNEKDTEDRIYTTYLGGERKGETVAREYKYNSATSQFFISLSTTATSSSKYCTFAKLNGDKSEEALQELMASIATYAQENYGEDGEKDFVTEYSVEVDEDDPIVGNKAKTVKFDVPNKPIVIKKVSVKKY